MRVKRSRAVPPGWPFARAAHKRRVALRYSGLPQRRLAGGGVRATRQPNRVRLVIVDGLQDACTLA